MRTKTTLFLWALFTPVLGVCTLLAVIYLMFRPRKPSFSNCAANAFVDWYDKGGYIAFRQSHYGWWPHFIWIKDVQSTEVRSYVPIQRNLSIRYAEKLFFKGHLIHTDVEFEHKD